MMQHPFGNARIKFVVIFMALLAIGASSTACVIDGEPYITIDGHGSHDLADVEVRWTINGSDAARLCGVFGVERWVVELSGPETRQSILDCRDHYWSTENDFLMLKEGMYSVRVSALDANDRELGSLETEQYLYDQGSVDLLRLDFRSSDLSY